MQKPEFVNLLSDYMNEISDPKNKEVDKRLFFFIMI
jgi:hypothetical protein